MATHRNINTSTISLGDLSNVTVSGPVTGQILEYNGSEWVNVTPYAIVSIRTESSSYNVAQSDEVILLNSTTALVTLPDPSTIEVGSRFTVKCIASGPTTAGIDTAAGLIDGLSSIVFSVQYESVTCVSDGSNYYII